MTREEQLSEKRQLALNSSTTSSTKPASSVTAVSTTEHQVTENQNGVRRIQDGESLYRPYVV